MENLNRRIGALLLLVIAVTLAGMIYFVHLAQTGMAARMSDWAAQRRAQGWTVEAQRAPGSWFLPKITWRNVKIAGGQDWLRGGFALSADRVDISVELLHPEIVHVTVQGNTGLQLASLPPQNFTADRLAITVTLRASFTGQGPRLAMVAIDGKNLHTPDGTGIGLLQAQTTFDEKGAQLDLRTEAAVLPSNLLAQNNYGLGQHISDLTLTAQLIGWPPAVGSRSARADIWQASGGRIDISNLVIGWGPLGLVGQGSLSLDQSLQPAGAATINVRGLQSLLAGMGINGLPVSDDQATFALRLKKSTVSLDRLGVAKLPHIDW